MSTTDVMSAVSVNAADSDQNEGKQTPRSNKSKSLKSIQPSVGILEEAHNLYENIPPIKDVFEVIDRIGSGTFSSVYLARLRQCPDINQQYALKHIIPTSHPSRIENELRCLQQIGGHDHVIGVSACIRQRDHVVIVMPYFPHDKFQDYVQHLSVFEVRQYMKALLTALNRVHKRDIIHRDIKPSNFLYNRKTKEFALVDFGLAMKAPLPLRTQNTADKNPQNNLVKENIEEKICPISPRKTRQTSCEKNDKLLPKKRKHLASDIENQPEPAPKRHQGNETGTGMLIERDINIENATASKALTPPTVGKQNYSRAVKSPRRLLLTKRALDLQTAPLFEQRNEARGRTSAVVRSRNTRNNCVVIDKNAQGKPIYRTTDPVSCHCFNKPQICSMCVARSSQHAPRAGTQGFRPPEVLMKCPDQSTAVDVWAAGVIFLSLLSGRYPFFKAPDDITALAQIISIFGTEQTKESAKAFGKNIQCQPNMPSLDLQTMCQKLRGIKSNQRRVTVDSWTCVPESAYDLLRGLLDLNPLKRLTAESALRHPFFSECAVNEKTKS